MIDNTQTYRDALAVCRREYALAKERVAQSKKELEEIDVLLIRYTMAIHALAHLLGIEDDLPPVWHRPSRRKRRNSS